MQRETQKECLREEEEDGGGEEEEEEEDGKGGEGKEGRGTGSQSPVQSKDIFVQNGFWGGPLPIPLPL